jgi:hypothetical protein
MSPILQQLIQMDAQKRAREPKQGMNPMEALRRMLEQRGMPEDIAPQRPTRPDPYPEPKRPPEPVVEPDYELPMMPNMPERPMYPEPYIDTFQDSVGPLGAIGSAIGQQAQRRYNQDAMGNQVEIGYDGTPLSNYTPDQMAIHNATMGITPSQSRYVFNGEGYDLVPNAPEDTPLMPRMGGVTLSNGQFIAGTPNEQGGVNIGTPDFFQQYAGNPDLMRALSDAYGYDVSQPRPQTTQAPETNYGGMNTNSPTTQNPQIGRDANDFEKMMENMRNQQMAENMRNEQRMVDPRMTPESPMQDPRQDTRINPEPPRPIYPMDMPLDSIGRRLG